MENNPLTVLAVLSGPPRGTLAAVRAEGVGACSAVIARHARHVTDRTLIHVYTNTPLP